MKEDVFLMKFRNKQKNPQELSDEEEFEVQQGSENQKMIS